jgi:WD40 repeat protein
MADALDVKKAHITGQWAHDRPLFSCRFDPQGRYVFAGSEDTNVVRWTLADGAKSVFAGHTGWPRSIGFSKDGETMISGDYHGALLWWPTAAEKPEPARRIDAHQGWLRALAVSPDGNLIATVGNDAAVRLWNMSDGAQVRQLLGHERPVYSVQFHPSGEFLVSGDLVGVIKQWNVATGELVRTFDAKPLYEYNGGQQVDYGGVRTMAFSADGKRLTAGGLYKGSNPLGAVNEPLELLWNWDDQKLLRSHIAEGITAGVIWRSAYLPDQTIVAACGGNAPHLLFWKEDADKDFHRLAMPNSTRDMDVHPDGIRVATAHFDKNVRIVLLAADA